MKKLWKKIGKICLIVLGSIVGLAFVVIAVFNVLKFVIYDDYYAMEQSLCKNPGFSDGFVCQGVCASEENGLLLVTGYMQDHSASRIYMTTLDNKVRFISLSQGGEPFTGHCGGIATTGERVFVVCNNSIYTLSLADVIGAENGAVLDVGEGLEVNNEAAYAYTDDEYLYVGEFHDGGKYNIVGHENETKEGTHYAICSQYDLDDLTKPVKVFSVRNKVQGICFMPDGKVVMSTSYGLASSAYYVYDLSTATDSGKTFDGAPLYYFDVLEREVSGPAMAEGMDYYDGKIITLTESASNKYIFGKFFNARYIVSLDLSKK